MTHSDRLRSLGLDLIPAQTPIGNFRNAVRAGSMLYVSGQGPAKADGTLMKGKVGIDVTTAEAYEHARLTGLNLLSVVAESVGGLDQVKRVVKLLGLVNAAPDFAEHPAVINGCSDLMVAVFGEAGQHARSAIGVGSLPNNITVEIEAIFELHN
ncbi:hypothetical protein DEM27_20950 [Metarhizobium album]|uniref:Endoribonuclease L-PSP/chorismate mutase-like domain-containing protein n=1 Tax=Metarhizobium album TaxID=2182425 RepID=A0A2U2DLJ8_9HYPH|nr:RidA family protein [Rhizobium album]PWE54184.1 hypothetical protein DEM27_20950 [Rhizobium album]